MAESRSDCEVRLDPEDIYRLDSLLNSDAMAPLEGKTIAHIHIYTLEVFDESDPDENNWLYRLLNRVHITTRPGVIEGQLLFRMGDAITIEKVAESERLLRAQKYLADALIVPQKICDDTVELAVIVRDIWALKLTGGFGVSGGESEFGAGIEMGNLLGTGNALTLHFQKDDERDKKQVSFSSPQLFGTRLRTRLTISNNSDGDEKIGVLERPFYSLDARWASGVHVARRDFDDYVERNNPYHHYDDDQGVFYGFSKGLLKNRAKRYVLGFQSEEDRFEALSNAEGEAPENRKRNYLWFGLHRVENKFGKFRNINQIQRTEDISLGQRMRVSVGYGPDTWGNDQAFYDFKASYGDALSIGKHHMTQMDLGVSGKYLLDSSEYENAIFASDIAYHHYISDVRRLYARLRYDRGLGITEDNKRSFEDEHVIRGYPNNFQSGDSRYQFNLELRRFYTMHLFNLFRAGHVFFFDVGKAWDDNQFSETDTLMDVGFGFRFSSSKARVGNIIHMDVAFPLTVREQVDSYQFTLKAFQRF